MVDPSGTDTASRAEWAERRLRATIVSGELAPGARVLVEEIAADWSVSPTPVREAVRTLAGEGLITLQPQRGARVAGISAQEMEDVYATRILLEPYVLRLSLERADGAWERRVEDAWVELERLTAANPRSPLDLEPAHTTFHQALLAACGSPSLLRICRQLQTQSLRYRILTRARRPGGLAESHAEHTAIHEAALARDERALPLVAVHLGRTVLSTHGPETLQVMIERIRAGQGISAPLLEALLALV